MLVDSFHRAGLLVFVYTADAPSDIQRALSLTSMGLYRTFLNASRVSSSYPPSLCLMLIDVLVETHNLGEYIAGLLTGYSPGSSLSPE